MSRDPVTVTVDVDVPDPPARPARPAALPAWARSLLDGGAVRLRCRPVDSNADALQGWLKRHSFQGWREASAPKEIRGLVPISAPFDLEFSNHNEWRMNDGLVVVGWRVDTRKPPVTTLKTEAARKTAEWARDQGMERAPRRILAHFEREVEEELRRDMVPSRKITPILWHPDQGWMIVHPSILDALRRDMSALELQPEPFGRSLPFEQREALGVLYTAATIRSTPVVPVAPEAAEDRLPTMAALADWLLWLAVVAIRQEGEGPDGCEWHLAGGVEITTRQTRGANGSTKVSRCDLAALPAALAEQGVLTAIRLRVLMADGSGEAFLSLTLKEGDGLLLGWELPKEETDKADEIETAVLIRLSLYESAERTVANLLHWFADVRLNPSSWAEFLLSARTWADTELQNRVGLPSLPAAEGGVQ